MWRSLYSGNRRVPHNTPNRRITRSRTTTTELLLILVIFPDESHNRRLDSGLSISLDIRNLNDPLLSTGANYAAGCVEGECDRLVAGLRFDDLLRAYHRCRRLNGHAWSHPSP